MKIPVIPVSTLSTKDAVIVSINQADDKQAQGAGSPAAGIISETKAVEKKLSASEISFLKVLIGSNSGTV